MEDLGLRFEIGDEGSTEKRACSGCSAVLVAKSFNTPLGGTAFEEADLDPKQFQGSKYKALIGSFAGIPSIENPEPQERPLHIPSQ